MRVVAENGCLFSSRFRSHCHAPNVLHVVCSSHSICSVYSLFFFSLFLLSIFSLFWLAVFLLAVFVGRLRGFLLFIGRLLLISVGNLLAVFIGRLLAVFLLAVFALLARKKFFLEQHTPHSHGCMYPCEYGKGFT